MLQDIVDKITKIGNDAKEVQDLALKNANESLKDIPEKQRNILSDLLRKAQSGEITINDLPAVSEIIKKQAHDISKL